MSSSIYVGIDVSQKQVEVAVVGAEGQLLKGTKPFANNLLGAEAIEIYLSQIAKKHDVSALHVATEATSFFDWHLLEFLASAIKGFEITLQSIPGIGPVYAAGIFGEIGDISRFQKEAQLARYAGLAWRKTQSGDFEADETPLMRSANAYLRYYLVEAANSVRNHEQSYRAFYKRNYNEVSRHQHKRALVLTARKLVRLIWALLSRGEIYQHKKVKP